MYGYAYLPYWPRAVIPWRPRQVWIDRQVVDSPVTANVLAHLPDVPTPSSTARRQYLCLRTRQR